MTGAKWGSAVQKGRGSTLRILRKYKMTYSELCIEGEKESKKPRGKRMNISRGKEERE